MGPVVGDVLPLAVGIAISPIPIIAAILMLLSPKARVTSVGFLLGWVLGIVVAATTFTLLSAVLPETDADASKPITAVIQLLLGAALLLLAVRQWRGRPRAGEDPVLPKWMQAIDKMSFVSTLGLGFLLSAVNPKNLLLAMSAGLTIGPADMSGVETVSVVVVFTVLAASTVLIPVLGYLIAADKLRGPLDKLRVWLAHENAVIMAVILLILGVVIIGKGLGNF